MGRKESTEYLSRVDGDGELRMRQRNERRVANDETEEHTADRRETDIKKARKDGLGHIEQGRYVIGLCLTAVTRPMRHRE